MLSRFEQDSVYITNNTLSLFYITITIIARCRGRFYLEEFSDQGIIWKTNYIMTSAIKYVIENSHEDTKAIMTSKVFRK